MEIERHSVHLTGMAMRARFILICAAIVLLPLLAGFATYYFFGAEERKFQRRISELDSEVAVLRSELAQVEQLKVNAEVASEVDKQAIEDLRKDLVSWSEKYSQQTEKVNFYQSLMDPSPSNSGVYIESAAILATDDERIFDYKILVAQRSSEHRRVSGSIQLELISIKNSDDVQNLSLNELTSEVDKLKLQFRFFQQLDGSLRLPDGFNPGQIKLVVEIMGDSGVRFEEYIDWTVRS